MKQIFTFILLSALSLTTVAQNDVKRVAILETVDRVGDVSLGVKNLLRQSITFGINRISGYEGYNRVDMAQINSEHNFQRSGYVSDADIKKLGQMTGASYVLIAEATTYDATHILVFANLVDVETGRVTNSSIPRVAGIAPNEMYEDCAEVAKSLLGVSSTGNNKGSVSSTSYGRSIKQDFTEEAWGINMKMIWVEGGDFLMGCTSEQGRCSDDEKNVHHVTVNGFYIGMLEVTQSQWEKVVGTNPSKWRGADLPVENVSWNDAMEFCRLLSSKTGRTYTLPTEAQWEYAARGGKKNEGTKYAGSNMIDDVAWYDENSITGKDSEMIISILSMYTDPDERKQQAAKFLKSQRCGAKRANALGIYDMSGNVWEWCKDWYSSIYVSYDTNDPTGPSSGYNRVFRGGSWFDDASSCRVAYRYYDSPDTRYNNLGFRVVCIP